MLSLFIFPGASIQSVNINHTDGLRYMYLVSLRAFFFSLQGLKSVVRLKVDKGTIVNGVIPHCDKVKPARFLYVHIVSAVTSTVLTWLDSPVYTWGIPD